MKSIEISKIILLALLICFVRLSFTQTLQKKPMMFSNPPENIVIEKVNIKSLPPTKADWFVFSDRENNPLYVDSQLKTKSKIILGLSQRLAVLEILDNNVLKVDVYKNKALQGQVGFISAKNVLLWSKSLVDPEYNIDIKAMVFYTFSSGSTGTTGTQKLAYLLPEKNLKYSKQLKGIFEYYFIYKKDKQYYLLGKESKINNNSVEFLVGWVDSSNVSKWSHRVAWENNWDKQALEERKRFQGNYGIIIPKLSNIAHSQTTVNPFSAARSVGNSVYTENFVDYNISGRRENTLETRFPIIELPKKVNFTDIIKVGIITELKSGDLTLQQDDYNKMTTTANLARNVNIIFVIDATQSMQQYAQSVRLGVINAINSLDTKENQKNQFRFGAVLYRDAAMSQPVEQWEQYLQPKEKVTNLFDWLDKRMNKIYCDGHDSDSCEALFYGLNSIGKYDLNPFESNYVILIGDCGDHFDKTSRPKVYVPMENVVKLYKDKSINLLTIQVHNDGVEANKKFVDQMRKFSSDLEELKVPLPPKPSMNNTYERIGTIKCTLLECGKGKKLDVKNDLAPLLREHIVSIDVDNDAYIEELTNLYAGEGVQNPAAKARVKSWLKKINLPQSEIDHILEYGIANDYAEGYAFLKCPECQYPLFKQVVMLERDQLKDIVDVNGMLCQGENYVFDDKKELLLQSLKTIAKRYFPKISDANIEKLELGSILMRITGKPCDSNIKFGSKTLCDITVADVNQWISEDEYKVDAFLIYFRGKQSNLSRIYNNNKYEGRFEIADSKLVYLFIPAENIP